MIEEENEEQELEIKEEIEPTEEELDKYFEQLADKYWKNKL